MNILSEKATEYPEDFEQTMKFFFGLNEEESLDNIQIQPSDNITFTVGNLYKAILKGKMIGSRDIDNPSWDNIENNGKDLKRDEAFPTASIGDLEEIYRCIMRAVKRHLVDKKTLASNQVLDLDPDQYRIYAFVIDRFYKSMIIDIQSNAHDKALDILK